MPKLTVVGDPHAKPNNLHLIERLFDKIEEIGHDCVILGDLLDTKELIRGKCLNTYYRRMRDSKLNFIVLVGNHDWFNLDCEEHSLEGLKQLDNVTVVDRPGMAHNCYFWPYMKGHVPDKFHELEKLPVFCHIDSPGFDYGNGHKSESGIDQRQLLRFPIVISGHYHKYQKKGNMIYLGTPFSHSYGESNQEKLIGIFDTETHEFEKILMDFPQHFTLHVPATQIPDLKPLTSTGHHVRVYLEGTVEEVAAVDRSVYPEVKFIDKPHEESSSEAQISSSQSPQVQFETWAKEIADLTPDVIELGLELLGDVS